MAANNPHAAVAIARAMADFEERASKPLYLICGMLKTKDPAGFLAPFKGLARHVTTVSIEGEDASRGAGELYDMARAEGFEASPADDLEDAMMQVDAWSRGRPGDGAPRVLICGSLYLAGNVLAENS